MQLLKIDKDNYIGQADPYIIEHQGKYYIYTTGDDGLYGYSCSINIVFALMLNDIRVCLTDVIILIYLKKLHILSPFTGFCSAATIIIVIVSGISSLFFCLLYPVLIRGLYKALFIIAD